MKFFESYKGCGCTSKQSPKRELAGYCANHGNDAAQVYRADGLLVWDWRQNALADHPAIRRQNMEEAEK